MSSNFRQEFVQLFCKCVKVNGSSKMINIKHGTKRSDDKNKKQEYACENVNKAFNWNEEAKIECQAIGDNQDISNAAVEIRQ